jgi:hypothetical protein
MSEIAAAHSEQNAGIVQAARLQQGLHVHGLPPAPLAAAPAAAGGAGGQPEQPRWLSAPGMPLASQLVVPIPRPAGAVGTDKGGKKCCILCSTVLRSFVPKAKHCCEHFLRSIVADLELYRNSVPPCSCRN